MSLALARAPFVLATLAAVAEARSSWARTSRVERATSVLLAFMIAGGVFLRIRGVAFPPTFTFDEPLFVPEAQSYLLGLPDHNDHPPLYKLFMAVGMVLFGYTSAGWRFPALCFGLLSIVLAGWVTRAAFHSARAGLIAAAFVAADGFFISYSRVGLMDGILTSLLLWCMLAALSARTWRGVLVTAVLVGAAVSVKWSALFVMVPVLFSLLWFGRVPLATLACFAIVPLIHAAIWMFALWISGAPASPHALIALIRELLQKHVGLDKSTNELTSRWYGWPVFYHPVVIKYTVRGALQYYSSTLGNPALWLAADAGLLAMLAGVVARFSFCRGAIALRLRRVRDFALVPAVGKPLLLQLAGWFAMYAPWAVMRTHYAFQHYYLPSYGCALIGLGGFVAHIERKRPWVVLVFVLLVVAAAIYFAPVWGEFPMREAAAHRRLMFRTWQP